MWTLVTSYVYMKRGEQGKLAKWSDLGNYITSVRDYPEPNNINPLKFFKCLLKKRKNGRLLLVY
jgi:hypothetical protein